MLNNKYVKGIAPLVIGIFLGILGNVFWSEIDKVVKAVLIVIWIVVLLLDIAYTAYIIWVNKSTEEIIKQKDEELKNKDITAEKEKSIRSSFEKLLNSLDKCYDGSAALIYKQLVNTRKTKKVDLKIWNHYHICDFVCEQLYEVIKTFSESGDNFSVSYITEGFNHKTARTNYIMISYAGKESAKPRIFNYSMDKYDAEKYYFWKMFNNKNPAVSYLMTNKEVNANFYFSDSSHMDEYTQYIGIPIYCSGHKMIGLIQIDARKGSIIASDKAVIENIINKYVMGLAHLILFADKVEKSISFTP